MFQLHLHFQPGNSKKPQKPFNLHRFLRNSKIVAVELQSAIVFFVWIFRAFFHEIFRQ